MDGAGKIECLHEGVLCFHATIQGSVAARESKMSEGQFADFCLSRRQRYESVSTQDGSPMRSKWGPRGSWPSLGDQKREETMKLGPYRIHLRPSGLIVPGLFFGFALYQYLYISSSPTVTSIWCSSSLSFILMIVFTFWAYCAEREDSASGRREAERRPSLRPEAL